MWPASASWAPRMMLPPPTTTASSLPAALALLTSEAMTSSSWASTPKPPGAQKASPLSFRSTLLNGWGTGFGLLGRCFGAGGRGAALGLGIGPPGTWSTQAKSKRGASGEPKSAFGRGAGPAEPAPDAPDSVAGRYQERALRLDRMPEMRGSGWSTRDPHLAEDDALPPPALDPATWQQRFVRWAPRATVAAAATSLLVHLMLWIIAAFI